MSAPAPKSRTKPIESPPDTTTARPVQSLPDIPQIKPDENPLETPPPKPPAKPAAKKQPKKTQPAPALATTAVPVQPASAPPSAPAAAAATSPVPQLGVLLTPEQRNQYEADYARDMASAMDGLTHVLEHTATPAQKESMTRIRSFLRQAEDAHAKDLTTAAQLARRAAVLAQDLVQSQR